MAQHTYEKVFNTICHQEKQIKTMVGYHVSIRMTKNNKTKQKLTILSVGKHKLACSFSANRNVN